METQLEKARRNYIDELHQLLKFKLLEKVMDAQNQLDQLETLLESIGAAPPRLHTAQESIMEAIHIIEAIGITPSTEDLEL